MDFLPLSDDIPVLVNFVGRPFRSRVVHWVRDLSTEHRWRAEDCKGTDCDRCIHAVPIQQRFSMVVDHNGTEKQLELPITAWRQVRAFYDQMGAARFYRTTFQIARYRENLTAHFVIAAVR